MDIDVGKLGRSFLAWWAGELVSLLPRPVRTMLLPVEARLDVTLDDRHIILDLLCEGEIRRTATLPRADTLPDRAAGRVIRSFVGAADEVVLLLPAGQVLGTVLDLPLSAGTALEESLAGEIARRTPFGRGEIEWDWRVRASDMELERLYVEVLIARRRDLSSALATMRALGIRPDRIEGPRPTEDDGEKPFDLLPADARERRQPRRGRLVRPLALAVLALAVAWGTVALERRKSELKELEERLAVLRAENEAVSAMEDRFAELLNIRSFLGERRRTAVPAVTILADVTRRLPDGDWLYGYSATTGAVSIQGFSRDASRLPNLLERSELLGNVAFDAPVRRSMQGELDDFTITARLGGAE